MPLSGVVIVIECASQFDFQRLVFIRRRYTHLLVRFLLEPKIAPMTIEPILRSMP